MTLVKRSGSFRSQVAEEPGLNASMPGRWVREFGSAKLEVTPGKALKTEQQQEFERLKRDLPVLRRGLRQSSRLVRSS